ncbi:hypothetical protein BDP81DRAFT_205216 [Colletotrichum phormii]|uniref:Uncharacterized protein n=1 Tax=Colletotrichum phormii TaxID=359342 RepID=A0AAI9ZUU1_9PEZI|nr:uncharacterized protein BDP81DRAFT_205216 [Colletotrichum phormii]KAK1638286.1 hypothetical protein BDP81DRAFT_205216 [Colletotrichum phormii]
MPGHTVAVLNTITKRFLDGTYWKEGVYVEKLETCRGFPMELKELCRMNTELVRYTDGIDKQKDTRPCGACGKEGQELKKCGGCGYYYYCDAPETGVGQRGRPVVDRSVAHPWLWQLW